MAAYQAISAFKKGSVRREFPSESLEITIDETQAGGQPAAPQQNSRSCYSTRDSTNERLGHCARIWWLAMIDGDSGSPIYSAQPYGTAIAVGLASTEIHFRTSSMDWAHGAARSSGRKRQCVARSALWCVVAATLLALCACTSDSAAVPTPRGGTPGESQSDGGSLAPSSTSFPVESADPTQLPTLSAAPVGEAEQTCTNAVVGYSLAYPEDWHALETQDPAEACTAFGPEPFSDADSASILAIDIAGGCYDSSGHEPIAEDRFMVDGFEAVRREFSADWNGPGMTYVIDRNPVPRCGTETHLLLFEADHDRPGEWETSKRVLERMVSTLDMDD